MRFLFRHFAVYSKIAFFLIIYSCIFVKGLLRLFLKPSKFLRRLFTVLFGFIFSTSLRSIVYSCSYFSLFISVLIGVFIFFFVLSAFLLAVFLLLPALFFEFALSSLVYAFIGFIVGPFYYLYFSLIFLYGHILSLVLLLARTIQRVLQALLGFLESLLSFAAFVYQFTPLLFKSLLGTRRSLFFSFGFFGSLLAGYSRHQFGEFSISQLQDASKKGEFLSLEPYFYTGLPGSLPVESLQIQESGDFEDTGIEYRSTSLEAFRFLQVLKKISISGVSARPYVRHGAVKAMYEALPGAVYSLDHFLVLDANYRRSWIQKDFYFSVPRRYESYVFSKYLKPAFISSLSYYNFLASFILPSSSFFQNAGFFYPRDSARWFVPDPSFELLYAYNDGSDTRLSLFLEQIRPFDVFPEGPASSPDFGMSTFHNTVLSGFHLSQLVDDKGTFGRPYLYSRPRLNRYWFKRVIDDHLMGFRSHGRPGVNSRYFSQIGSLVVWFIILFGSLGPSVVRVFRSFLERSFVISFTSAATSIPFFSRFFIVVKEGFFRLLNSFILYRPSRPRFRFSKFKLFVDSLVLKCLFAIALFYRFASFLEFCSRLFLRPIAYVFSFARFLVVQFKAGKLLTLLENEVDSWFITVKKIFAYWLGRVFRLVCRKQ